MNRLTRLLAEPERVLALLRYQSLKLKRACAPRWSSKHDRMEWQRQCDEMLRQPPPHMLLVMGVPRSGTTVLTALLTQIESLLVLSEPLLMRIQQGFFRWTDKSGRPRVCLHTVRAFLDAYTGQGLHGPGRVLLKETWRSEQHDVFPNDALLNGLRSAGIPTLAVIRDPRAVWYSHCSRYGAVDPRRMPSRLHIHEWNRFGRLVLDQQIPFVRYEDVASNPAAAFQFATESLQLSGSSFRNQITSFEGLGDERALSGGSVNSASLQKYLRLDAGVRDAIMDGCGEVAARFGYDTHPVSQERA